MGSNRLIVGVVVLAGATLAASMWRTPSRELTLQGVQDSVPLRQGTATGGPEQIDLELLRIERGEPAESTRNPFRFKPRAAPPPPPSASPTLPPPSTASSPQDLAPPRITLKFIGTMSSSDPSVGRVAVLTDGRGVYHGREGEIVEGRYRILKIGVESIELAHLDGSGRQTIRQTGQ